MPTCLGAVGVEEVSVRPVPAELGIALLAMIDRHGSNVCAAAACDILILNYNANHQQKEREEREWQRKTENAVSRLPLISLAVDSLRRPARLGGVAMGYHTHANQMAYPALGPFHQVAALAARQIQDRVALPHIRLDQQRLHPVVEALHGARSLSKGCSILLCPEQAMQMSHV
jgi:hypothetical protein